MLDTILKAKLTGIFKEVDIESYIDNIDESTNEILIGSRVVDMYGNTGATILFKDVELDDVDKPYTIKWRTLAELHFDDICGINTALWEMQEEIYSQRVAKLTHLISPIEEDFDVELKLESHRKYSDGTIAFDFKCSPKDSKSRVRNVEVESFKINDCYIDLINDMDLSRRMGQLIAERIEAVSNDIIKEMGNV